MGHWRAARDDDDDELVAMFAALNREDPGQEPVPPENMRRTLRELRARPERGRAVVLESEGRAAGYALLIAFWSNELGGDCCSLDELYVIPALRSQGHASTLIRALAVGSSLWPHAAVAILLEVSPDNHRALALYRRQGFTGSNLCLRLVRPQSPRD